MEFHPQLPASRNITTSKVRPIHSSPRVTLLSITQEKLFRAILVILRSREEQITAVATNYLKTLMANRQYYTDVLITMYFNHLDSECKKFYATVTNNIDKCNALAQLINNNKLNNLDMQYILNCQYLPLRHQIETSFQTHLQQCKEIFGFDFAMFEIKHPERNFLLLNNKDVTKIVQHRIYNLLCKEFKGQLTVLEPHGQKFTGDKKHKVMEQILNSLTDYDCFHWQYHSGGNRTYLSYFCQSVEKVLQIVLTKTSKETNLEANRIKLTDKLWKLFVNLLAIMDLEQKFLLYSVNGTNNNNTFDLDIYFSYSHLSVEQLVFKLNIEKLLTQDEDEIRCYYNCVNTYYQVCKEICETTEAILPLFMTIFECPSERSGSDVRRTKGLELVTSSIDDLYNNFSLIKNNYLTQQKVLEIIGFP